MAKPLARQAFIPFLELPIDCEHSGAPERKLSPLRGPANLAGYSEFLERGLQPCVCDRRCCGGSGVILSRGVHSALGAYSVWIVPCGCRSDSTWVRLLSSAAQYDDPFVGSASDDNRFHDASGDGHSGEAQHVGRPAAIVSVAGVWRPLRGLLETFRRSAVVRIGAVRSYARAARSAALGFPRDTPTPGDCGDASGCTCWRR